MPAPLGRIRTVSALGVAGRRLGRPGGEWWLRRVGCTQAGHRHSLATLGSLSLSAWISCQPVTHQVATHQPLTGRLTHLWERTSESGEWCRGQQLPPLLEQILQLVTSHFWAIVYHPVLFYFCTDMLPLFHFLPNPWSMVVGQLVIEIYVEDKKVFANVNLR